MNPTEGTLLQVDPGAGRVRRTIRVGGIPRAVTTLGDRVWVVATADGAPAVARQVSGVTPLPGSICENVVAGQGQQADLLIVSDLPLQGGTRLTTTQMAQAITFVLRARGFRAGRFRVAYQSCDDSVSRTGLFDEGKCAANARAYGENPDVIGVIGTLNSGCALVAIPVLNRARGGAVPIVSPSNSVVGLTRSGPGTPPGLPASLYPTGRRNYLRVFPTDDLQGAAHALLARNRGHSKVFVLDDGDPLFGSLWAAGFDVAARNLGMQIAGRATWDPQATDFRELAARVAQSGCDGGVPRRAARLGRCAARASASSAPRPFGRALRAGRLHSCGPLRQAGR